MIEATASFLEEFNIKNKTVLAALSGGVDSSVLFFILNKLKSRFNLEINAVHLNHNWRGEDSLGDEKFCKELASAAGCGFYTETLEDDVKKTEADAREARYSFFERALKKFNTDICFLAHNKNDNAETLIYRVIKGTGVSGLAAISKVRAPYYRPLLDFSREEIENFAHENNIAFRVDKSNEDTKYKRNFIRHKILPEIEKINENALNAITSLARLAGENNEMIEDYILLVSAKVFNKDDKNWYFDKPSIKRSTFLTLKEPLQREILSRYFKGLLKNRDYKTIVKIQNFIKNNENSTLSINWDAFLKVKNDTVFLYRRNKEN